MNHAEDADLTTVKGLSPLLSAAISEARKYGKLTGRVSDGELHYSLNANRAKQHAVAEEWNGAPFWTCSTSQAEKKGWDWSGDTEVVVRTIHASSAKEFIVSYLLYTQDGTIFADVAASSSGGTWEQFWDAAVGYENDLPHWPGSPTAELVLQRDGNRRVMVAEKDHGAFYAVTYDTS